jgi:hypothetical protein
MAAPCCEYASDDDVYERTSDRENFEILTVLAAARRCLSCCESSSMYCVPAVCTLTFDWTYRARFFCAQDITTKGDSLSSPHRQHHLLPIKPSRRFRHHEWHDVPPVPSFGTSTLVLYKSTSPHHSSR